MRGWGGSRVSVRGGPHRLAPPRGVRVPRGVGFQRAGAPRPAWVEAVAGGGRAAAAGQPHLGSASVGLSHAGAVTARSPQGSGGVSEPPQPPGSSTRGRCRGVGGDWRK